MQDFLRRRAVSLIAAFCGQTQVSRAAAKRHANRSTVAKKVGRLTAARKNDTIAETYGEPQTPADLRYFSTAAKTVKRGLCVDAEASH